MCLPISSAGSPSYAENTNARTASTASIPAASRPCQVSPAYGPIEPQASIGYTQFRG
ncbi:uncharacterized protein HMPREF1541_04370 [Cyphellophora europaea CBS 101466]|uniref:Uncharacterized protein n=1 Tax=Cyphellophora europaea (strain CBS 101466) TaxID=1220924 RepID=W2RUW4_CYPE1|nr:uncharacterized protein HMPREF1541_04370 [Cyphellophora europaea CBS 101466]ETN40095.1 hypothetical protein HMPREF1541_04370 [Cyphellophora europaea CBS 101466]